MNFYEKAVCFEFLKILLETEKKPGSFLCCNNDVELNMSIVKFEFEFTRLSTFTMT